MISPLREDTLEFHHRQLRFMRYPIAFFLIANVTCVLHALTLKRSPNTTAVDAPKAVSASDTLEKPQFETHVQVLDPPTKSVAPLDVTEVAKELDPTRDEPPVIAEEEQPNAKSAQVRQQLLANLQKRRLDWQAKRAKAPAVTPAEENRPAASNPEEKSPSVAAADTEMAAKPEPVRQTVEDRGVQNTEIVVLNPSNSPAPISFLLDKALTTLKPGEFRILSTDTEHTVQFHRGGDFGNASVKLKAGEYAFSVGTQGWQLGREEE